VVLDTGHVNKFGY